jgi:hypothetical protein
VGLGLGLAQEEESGGTPPCCSSRLFASSIGAAGGGWVVGWGFAAHSKHTGLERVERGVKATSEFELERVFLMVRVTIRYDTMGGSVCPMSGVRVRLRLRLRFAVLRFAVWRFWLCPMRDDSW